MFSGPLCNHRIDPGACWGSVSAQTLNPQWALRVGHGSMCVLNLRQIFSFPTLQPHPRAVKRLSAGSVLTMEIPSHFISVYLVLEVLACSANCSFQVQE